TSAGASTTSSRAVRWRNERNHVRCCASSAPAITVRSWPPSPAIDVLHRGANVTHAIPLVMAAAAKTPKRLANAVPTVAPTYLPDPTVSNVVTVTTGEHAAEASITLLTEAVAVKETGPKATVRRFGEVYTFSPSFVAVHRDQPTA